MGEMKAKEKATKERKAKERRTKEIKAKWSKPFWDVQLGYGTCTPTNGKTEGDAPGKKLVGVPQCALYAEQHCKVKGAVKIDSKQDCQWAGSRMIKGCSFKCQRKGEPPAGWTGPAVEAPKKGSKAAVTVDLVEIERSLQKQFSAKDKEVQAKKDAKMKLKKD